MSDTAIAIVLALLAGLSYATAAVLQQRVAAQQAPELSLSPRLILALFRRPLWLLGGVFDLAAYGCEAGALAAGSVVIVGPLLVSGLLFALPLATVGQHVRVTRREMVPAVFVTAGLAVYVAVSQPRGTSSHATTLGWLLAGGVVALVAGTAVVIGRRAATAPNERALLYGVATGTIYGLTAILTKATVDLFGDGVLDAFTHWQPYVLVGASIIGMVLNQSAFQAGHVAASLPAIAVVNPVLASTFGVLLFHEHFDASGPVAWIATVLAIIAMTAGTVRLARSPLVAHAHSESESIASK